MTGTAQTEEQEFRNIYNMDVVQIPTNRPVIRKDLNDIVYKTERAKFKAVANDVEAAHAKGQPVLVGTISIEKSEELSSLLKKRGIPHQVLNAKYHEKEAEIVALAGQMGAVTIATNMAGRGTDIKLGEGVKEIGGLKIIGTERHESRRIDNQLRGRAGRQGDPGESRFYISLEDDLMRLFGGDRTMKIVDTLGLEEDDPIENKMLGKAIENAQKKVEGNNFATRKHLLEYDQVMNEQRETIYAERKRVLYGEDLRDSIINMMKTIIDYAIEKSFAQEKLPEDWDLKTLNEYILPIIPVGPITISDEEIKTITKEKLAESIFEKAKALYAAKEEEINAVEEEGEENRMRDLERYIMLRVIDQKWMDHIDDMDQMKQGIGLHSIGQKDPLIEYKYTSFDMFEELNLNIQIETVRALMHVRVVQKPIEIKEEERQMFTNKDDSVAKEPIKNSEPKVGRNDPCPCGSGKKYKNCCGKDE